MKGNPFPVTAVSILLGIVTIAMVCVFKAIASSDSVMTDLPIHDEKYQGVLLGLVVALAAYIGGVERDLAKRASEHQKACDDRKAMARKRDIGWLIPLDGLLIILGLLMIAQMIIPKQCCEIIDWLKMFKVVLFPVTFLYLAVLHVRQWTMNRGNDDSGDQPIGGACTRANNEIQGSDKIPPIVKDKLACLLEEFCQNNVKGLEIRNIACLLSHHFRHVK